MADRRPRDLAYAVVHGDPPEVYAAEDVDVLQRVLGLEVVATTSPDLFGPIELTSLRQALLDERWGDAVLTWMERMDVVIDIYPGGLTVWSSSDLDAGMVGAEFQFRRLFRDV